MTRNYLIESDVEIVAIEWLKNQGYTHLLGADIHRNFKKVVLEDHLRHFLLKQYPSLPEDVLSDAIRQLLFNEGADLDICNRSFHLKLSNGLNLNWLDKDWRQAYSNGRIQFNNNPINMNTETSPPMLPSPAVHIRLEQLRDPKERTALEIGRAHV